MKQIIIKKFYEVISIINKKRHNFKGFYKGPLLGPLLTNRILNRTKFMKQTQRDGRNNKYVLIPEVNILGRKNTKRTQRDGRNDKYVLIHEVKILGRKNTKQTQRRGRNIWHGWFN